MLSGSRAHTLVVVHTAHANTAKMTERMAHTITSN